MPCGATSEHLEKRRFCDRCSGSQLSQHPGVGVEGPGSLNIAGIVVGYQRLPLGADEPGAFLFPTHRTPDRFSDKSMTHYAARRTLGADGGSPSGSLATIRAAMPQSRRHSTAISASSRGMRRTQAPLVMLRITLSPS